MQLVLDHISEIICSSDLASTNYLLDLHAFHIQRLEKPGVMVALVGDQGVGKTTLYADSTRNSPIFKSLYDGTGGFYEVLLSPLPAKRHPRRPCHDHALIGD